METTKKKEGVVLTPEALEIFKKKTQLSVHVLPICHGGYSKDDVLCQNCSVATGDKILVEGIDEIATRTNAKDTVYLRTREFGAPFFAMYSRSCAEERKELENAVFALETANRMREERRAIKNITRMPKGEVREGEAPFDYVKYYTDGLWVRLNKHGDKFTEAVGILYRYDGRDTNPGHPDKHYFRADRIVGYIKNILVPAGLEPISTKEYFLIFPKSQTTNPDGNLFLKAAMEAEGAKEDETLLVELYAGSFQTVSARFDDIGRL